jgi:hypothetical protein
MKNTLALVDLHYRDEKTRKSHKLNGKWLASKLSPESDAAHKKLREIGERSRARLAKRDAPPSPFFRRDVVCFCDTHLDSSNYSGAVYRKLKKIRISGGEAQTLADAIFGSHSSCIPILASLQGHWILACNPYLMTIRLPS